MNIFTLRNKFSSFLMLVLMVAALSMMTACSSTDDPAEDDAAADESSGVDASIREMCKAESEGVDEFEKCIRDNTP